MKLIQISGSVSIFNGTISFIERVFDVPQNGNGPFKKGVEKMPLVTG
jgi:hypothetical protein